MTLDEPACAYWLAEAGYNPSEQLYATCTDIDPMVADMAFIQLALLGIPAKVVTGNTLTLKANRVRYTPFITSMTGRDVCVRSRLDAMKNFLATVAA
jgi:hypothetical protein